MKSKTKKLSTIFVTSAMMLNVVMPMSNVMAFNQDQLKIGVMSDTHYFSNKLYQNCDDFTTAMNSDRKMFQESEAILDAALDDMVEDAPDVVFISGDLTKDGEQINHEAVANKLKESKKRLKDKGVDTQFYVINGNHDINNPNGKDFSSGKAEDADCTTVEEFKQIYKDFGYGDKSVQYKKDGHDGGSLSYVTQIAEGYTLIAVDSGKYSSDQTDSHKDLQETGGVISKDLLNWVKKQAQEAKSRGDVVMVVQHHGVIPHFEQEPTVMTDYLVDNYQEVAEAYADSGVSYVLTGHMHASDIAEYTSKNGNKLYDIETGSLVTYSSMTRDITIKKGTFDSQTSSTIKVESESIKNVQYKDFDTGEVKLIKDLTAYGKEKTLNPDVIKTMINEGVLDSMLDDMKDNGGIKSMLASLLSVEDTSKVSTALTQMLVNMLPQSEETALELSLPIVGTYKVFHDANSKQIKLREVKTTKSTYSLSSNMAVVKTADGEEYKFEIPTEIMKELENQIVPYASNPAKLFIADEKIPAFLDDIFVQIDPLLEDHQNVYDIVNAFADSLLNKKVDDNHTVFDLVDYVYQTHLAGEETCESWAETAIDQIKNNGLLNKCLKEAIKDAQPVLKEKLSKVKINLSTMIEAEAGSSIPFTLKLGLAMIKDLGTVVGFLDIAEIIPNDLYTQIDTIAYNVAYSMTHDNNYQKDNNTSITLTRTYLETIYDANLILSKVSKIDKSLYTSKSVDNLESKVKLLNESVKNGNQKEIVTAIKALEKAMDELEKKSSNIQTETTDKPAKPSHNNNDKTNQTINKVITTGDETNMVMIATGLILSALLIAYLVRKNQAKKDLK